MKWLPDAALERLRTAADMPDLSGTRYRLVDKLGQGGMGGVYRVEDTLLERNVALKAINLANSREWEDRLLREARVIAQLEHPGIVPVHDVGTLPDGRVYYTMKLVQGHRLDDEAAALGNLADRLRVFQKICDAVSFAHAHGVLHRDLKPANIMIGPFGEVLVMDWGLSKLLGQAESKLSSGPLSSGTGHGSVLGTPGYMAPEQARGEISKIDCRSDIYSLGAVLDFLIPRPAPKVLQSIVAKAKAEDASARYASAGDLAADIAHYLDGRPVGAYPEGVATRLWRWARRNRSWLLLIAAYLIMRTILILWRTR